MITSIILLLTITIYTFLVIKCCIKFYKYNTKTENLTDCKVSVLVSAKNEEKNIRQFLTKIKSQTYKNIELIIIDDNSTDETYEVAKKGLSGNMRIFKNVGKGKKEALKFGLQFCTGNYIFSTDADCFPEEKWIETLVRAAETNKSDMLMAPVIIKAQNGKSLFQRLWQAESFSLITITSGTCIEGKPVMCNGGNIGYKAEFWKSNISKIKKEYASGDDMFMMESAEKQQKKITYVKDKDALIITDGVETWKQLINQRARWVSKTGGYTEKYTLYFALMILLGNLAIIAGEILTALSIIKLGTFLVILLMKFFADYYSVRVSSEYYKMPQKISDIIILEIIYPYYVVASIMSYLTKGFKWK